jgi:hypothetical protein
VYAGSGALVAVRTFLTVAPFALSRLLGAAGNAPLHRTADAIHVGATVGRPALPIGLLLMREGFKRNAIAEREADIDKCKKKSPSARH